MQNWQLTISQETLKEKARILALIRAFFARRNILEVSTPLLSSAGVTDIHLHSLKAKNYYLQTSPEFAMKRLLAAGSGSIYQICKAFRDNERGRYHRIEFTMLEWYRLGFNHHNLMDEMNELLQEVLTCQAANRLSYQEAFQKHVGINPHLVSVEELQRHIQHENLNTIAGIDYSDKDLLLQLLMTEKIEPHLGKESPMFIYDYPASQAMLAKIQFDNPPIAERFEVYYKGIELANGFHELTDAKEQRERFKNDLAKRKELGYPAIPIDEEFLAALEHGLPDCSGVALGVDRLIMLALGRQSIAEVMF